MVLFYVFGVLHREPPDQYKKNVQEQLIVNTIEQYKIDKKSGSLMEICVQAGIVAGAYKSILDEENYKKWKAIERDDCSKVGVLPSRKVSD